MYPALSVGKQRGYLIARRTLRDLERWTRRGQYRNCHLRHYQAQTLIQLRCQQLHAGLRSHGHMHNGRRRRAGRGEAEAR